MANKRAKNGEMEYRFNRGAPAEATEDGQLSGRAAPFNSTTMIGDKPWGFREKISPGAFTKSVNDGDVVLLDNHDHAKPIARQSAGTLALEETPGGLDWQAKPANTTYANDARENAKAGNYGGCSFGFQVVRDSWHYNQDDDVDERTLHEVKLHEISVCTFPAYADTTVSARDAVEAAETAKERYYFREYGKDFVDAGVEFTDEERDGDSDEERASGKTPAKPYGKVKYADPGYQKDGKARYPVDTAAHAKAAWSYINMPKNEALYSAADLAKVKSAIKAACKKFGIEIDDSKDSALEDVAEVRTNETGVDMTFLDKVAELALSEDREPAEVMSELRRLCFDELRAQVVADTRAVNDVSGTVDDDTPKGDGGPGDFGPGDQLCETCGATGFVGDGDEKEPCPDCTGNANVDASDTGDKGDDAKTPAFGLNADPDLQDKGFPAEANAGEHSKDSHDETREDGQPGTPTDEEDEGDATRYLRMKMLRAKQRRDELDSE